MDQPQSPISRNPQVDAALKKAVWELMELCDTVQINVTLHNTEGRGETTRHAKGAGNFYARIQSCEEWVESTTLSGVNSESTTHLDEE